MQEAILNYLILDFAKTLKFDRIKLIINLRKKINLVCKSTLKKNNFTKIKDKERFPK